MIYLILTFILNLRAELQLEARVPLKISGYTKIRKHFAGKTKQRTDLYFDYFEGIKFHLENLNKPLKLRFKEKNNSVEMQISTKEFATQITDCEKLDFFVSSKISFEEDIDRDDYLKIFDQSKSAIKSLLAATQDNNESDFNEMQNFILQLNHAQWYLLEQSSPRSKYFLVPTFWANRAKLEKDVTYNSKNLILTLKASKSYDISLKEFESFEIELQPEDSQEWTLDEFTKAVCHLIPKEITATDIESNERLEKDSSLYHYIKNRHKLGF